MPGIRMPKGFSVLRDGGATLIVSDAYRRALLEEGVSEFIRRIDSARREGGMRGRGEIGLLQLPPRGGARLVVRHYRRGGLFGKLARDLYLGMGRGLRELQLYADAAAGGVPTLKVVALVARKAFSLFYRFDLVSLELTGCLDLAAYYKGKGRHAPPRARSRILGAAARAVRRMHEGEIDHFDLNMKNILVRRPGEATGAPAEESEAYVIDLDNSVKRDGVEERHRIRNLLRLYRSAQKFRHYGLRIPPRDEVRFAKAYCAGDRTMLRRIGEAVRRYRRTIALHRIFWRRGKEALP